MMPETRILDRLLRSEVEFVIIGGLAAIVHGVSLTTKDIDVCLDFTEPNLRRLAQALNDLNPKHRLTAQRLPFEINDKNWFDFKNIYLQTDWGILDCLGEVLGIGKYPDAVKMSVVSNLPIGACKVLSIDALIRAKSAIGRDQDLAAVRQLTVIKQRRG